MLGDETDTIKEVLSVNIIQDFFEKGIAKLIKVPEEYAKHPEDFNGLVSGVRKVANEFELKFIADVLEARDEQLRESLLRKDKYVIVRKDRKELITSLGTVQFEKTLFKSKETGESEYPLDRLLGFDRHQRLSEDAKVKLLEEAVQTSYRRTGEETCINEDEVTKETVKDLLHELEFPEEAARDKKKRVPYLYIDADEDHISLQFREKKGDLRKVENGYKENTEIGKLIYVYEGIEPEAPKSARHRLINAHYFSGVYHGEKNRELWEEVYRYIDSHYEMDQIRRLYVNGDGAAWIKASKKHLEKVVHVLDEHHLDKYISQMTAHMKNSREDAACVYKNA